MATQSFDGGRLVCVRCFYEWMPRKEQLPKRCPKCRSVKWNESNLRVACKRCGHEWNSHDGSPVRCPGCGSYKWDEPMCKYECKRCGNEWNAKGSKVPRRCPQCYSRLWNVDSSKIVREPIYLNDDLEMKVLEEYRKGSGCIDISILLSLPYSTVRGIISRETGAVPKT